MKTRLFSKVILLSLLVLLGFSLLLGGNDGRRGTAGASELLIPVGAKSCGMSGAVISSVAGAEAIYWNPAGASQIDGSEVSFSHLSYIADIGVNYFALASNFGSSGTFGISLKTLSFGDIPITTTDLPEGTGGTFSPSYITVGLTYSNRFTDRIFGGATLKYISEKIVRTQATGFAVDLGIQYKSNTGLKLGVVLKNLGPSMQFDGPDLEYFTTIPVQDPGSRTRPLRLATAGFELPSTLEIGLGYDILVGEQHNFELGGTFQNTNFGSDEYRFGAEYGWNKMFFVRAGITRTQNQSEYIFGPTFGVGVNISVGEKSFIAVDYSYRKTDFFSGNQWLDVKLAL
jgi:hypothetical protein